MKHKESEEEKIFGEQLKTFLNRELVPVLSKNNFEPNQLKEFYKKLADNGYISISLPEDLGGFNLPLIYEIIFYEELATVDGGVALSVLTNDTLGLNALINLFDNKKTVQEIISGGKRVSYAHT